MEKQEKTITKKSILLSLDADICRIIDDVKHWRNVSRNKLLQTIISDWLISNQSEILKEAESRNRERNNMFNPAHPNVDTLDDIIAQWCNETSPNVATIGTPPNVATHEMSLDELLNLTPNA